MRIKGFPYEYFDGFDCDGNESKEYKDNNFIKTFLVDKKSFVKKQAHDENLFNAIKSVYQILSKQNGAKDKSFAEAIKGIEDQDQILVLNHALWLWCFPNSRKTHYELGADAPKDKKGQKEKLDEYTDIPAKSIAGAGSGYVQTKTNGVRFIVYIFKECFNLKSQEIAQDDAKEVTQECIKAKIEELCKKEKYGENNIFSIPDGVKNLLLHLCKPSEYEPIASTADKKRIIKAINEYKGEEVKIKGIDLDKTLADLRKDELVRSVIDKESFYHNYFPLFWKSESISSTLSRAQLLEYKKAMVLYGPPGTGKTYTAMELAKEIIIRHCLKYKQTETIKGFFDNEKKIKNEKNEDQIKVLKSKDSSFYHYIHYLQLHINYNYEDFIAGQTMDKDGVSTKKGFIFDIIEKAQSNSNMPYVVILDEMNRVDVSRVFGELFTAIEKREEDVYLTLKDKDNNPLKLNVPKNVYFIGTMNEIDFSLERIDFALRRRFIWERHDYSEDSLESIINHRLKSDVDENVNVDDFITCCSAVNKLIDKEDSLGPNYHIGHAFFAEVADIYKNLKESSSGANNWNQARNILLEISILPTLDAYCGSMDKTEKKTFIENCKKAYNGNSSDLDNEEYEVEETNS